jgi:hypothetical protein
MEGGGWREEDGGGGLVSELQILPRITTTMLYPFTSTGPQRLDARAAARTA